ncbi:MAG: glycoside hydrolase family 9 protein [Lachnospiraceae bacterium]|nr:glycoside hydrolase family 9 protein [Lachnospiraceae bacterium]
MHQVKKTIAFLLTAILLAGCGIAAQTEQQPASDAILEWMEEAPVLEYDVPVISPGVLVNQIGYNLVSPKTVIVRGKRLPGEFHIVDALTGEVVFTGKLEKSEYAEEIGEYNSYGDFTAFEQEGTYYIECDIIGCSYEFEIKDGLYEELLEKALELLRRQRELVVAADIVDICKSLSVLLLSYELYTQVYEKEEGEIPPLMTELKSYVEELLLLQEAGSGAVMEGETVYLTETVWVSAVLAKFSYSYQKYDSVYATACLQAADRAWRFTEKQGEETEAALRFFAAAELYRATGQSRYYNAVTRLGENLSMDRNNRALVFGVLTYASTKRKVDMGLCEDLMADIFAQAEQIAAKAQTDIYLVGNSVKKESLEDIFWDTVVLSTIDYIITNQEYATLIARHHNYLAGANETADCYIPNAGGERELLEGITTSRFNIAGYIMLLSEMMSHEEE